jgi:ketosteroid isomerase-like protein
MSHENVEIVRRVFEAWSRGELDLALSAMAETIEWQVAEDEPDVRTLHGRAEIRAMVEGWAGSFEEFSGTPQGFIDAGEHVIIPIVFTGSVRGSDARVSVEETQVYTVQAGTVTKVREYRTKSEALEAVGLAG